MANQKTKEQRIAAIKALFPIELLSPSRYDAAHVTSARWWGEQIFLRVQLRIAAASPTSPLSLDQRKSLAQQLIDSPFAIPSKPQDAPPDSVWLADFSYTNFLQNQRNRFAVTPLVPLRIGRVHNLMSGVPVAEDGALDPCVDPTSELFSALGPAEKLSSPFLYRLAVEVDLRANNEAIVTSLKACLNEHRSKLSQLKSQAGIEKLTMEKWRDQRQLLYFDATLWRELFRSGVRGGKTRALELARLSGDAPDFSLEDDPHGSLEDALGNASSTIFTHELAMTLLALPD